MSYGHANALGRGAMMRGRSWVGYLLVCALLVLGLLNPVAAGPTEVKIGFIARKPPVQPANALDAAPVDEGAAGARLAIGDNTTTGMLTGQSFRLTEVWLDQAQSAVDAARGLLDGGSAFLVVNLPADELVAVADALKDRPGVIMNAGAADDSLREGGCRPNVFHVAASRAMVADALAQFLAAKRWRKLFLVVGPKPEDRLYAEAVRRAATKFGLKVTAEKDWDFGPLARARADGPTQSDALVFTRGIDADIILVADEAQDFGDYIPFHTWDPKLVAGTQGLVAVTWHRTLDAWGAAQLQSRFLRTAKRSMRPLDYQAWTAVRAIGEAATRSGSADPKELARFLVSGDFELAAFKGVPVSFRPWDRQLRQPILVVQPTALVSISPQPGFLHQRTPLDTLGFDQPESKCKAE